MKTFFKNLGLSFSTTLALLVFLVALFFLRFGLPLPLKSGLLQPLPWLFYLAPLPFFFVLFPKLRRASMAWGFLALVGGLGFLQQWDWLGLARLVAPFHLILSAQRSIYNLAAVLIYALLCFCFYRIGQRFEETPSLNILLRPPTKIYPYGILLIVALPFVFYASTLDAFQSVYPRCCRFASFSTQTYSMWSVVLFEISYILQFVALELFFRGFLLFGLFPRIGNQAILVSTFFYALLHFTKPFPEALSSLFGGSILCGLALKTRNVVGGIILHIGLALLMEIFGFYHF